MSRFIVALSALPQIPTAQDRLHRFSIKNKKQRSLLAQNWYRFGTQTAEPRLAKLKCNGLGGI